MRSVHRYRRLPLSLALGLFALVLSSLLPTVASALPTRDRVPRVDDYLASVASEMSEPGLYVDPEVLDEGLLARQRVARLDRRAKSADGPVRIFVLQGSKLWAPGSQRLAYDHHKISQILHRQTGNSPGTIVVLVSAATKAQGRALDAFQWPGSGPKYDVGMAAENAIECCAPGYADMLSAFLDQASVPLDDDLSSGYDPAEGGYVDDGEISDGTTYDPGFTGFDNGTGGPMGAGAPFGLFALAALGFGALRLVTSAARTSSPGFVGAGGTDPWESVDIDDLRAPLTEEVIELSDRVSTLPSAATDPEEVTRRTTTVLNLVEEARQRLDSMSNGADARFVTERLADARFELLAIQALREGKPAPVRTPPCFLDPRHGPSQAQVQFTPPGGVERTVEVCLACQRTLAAGAQPAVRQILHDGNWQPYWLSGPAGLLYLNAYWGGQQFADPAVQFQRQSYLENFFATQQAEPGRHQSTWDHDNHHGSSFFGTGSSAHHGGGGSFGGGGFSGGDSGGHDSAGASDHHGGGGGF